MVLQDILSTIVVHAWWDKVPQIPNIWTCINTIKIRLLDCSTIYPTFMCFPTYLLGFILGISITLCLIKGNKWKQNNWRSIKLKCGMLRQIRWRWHSTNHFRTMQGKRENWGKIITEQTKKSKVNHGQTKQVYTHGDQSKTRQIRAKKIKAR